MLRSLLRKLFLVKEIKSKTGELHFQRFRLIQTPWFAVYLHYIAKADADKHPHSHPWNFRTVVLKGGYQEVIWLRDELNLQGKPICYSRYLRFLSSAYTNRLKNFHQLVHLYGPTWTLVFVGKDHENWGYLVERCDRTQPPYEYTYLDFETYRIEKRKGRWSQ